MSKASWRWKLGTVVCATTFLAACQTPEKETVPTEQIEKEPSFEAMMKQNDFESIRVFVSRNLFDDQKEEQIKRGFVHLFQTGDKENYAFLQQQLHKIIEKHDWVRLSTIVKTIQTTYNTAAIELMEQEIEKYENYGQDAEEMTERHKQILEMREIKLESYAYKFPEQPEVDQLIELTGTILDKVSDNEYLVQTTTTPYSGKVLLETFTTTFNSDGTFTLVVVPEVGEASNYTLEGQTYPLLYEVPPTEIEEMNKVLASFEEGATLQKQVRELMVQRDAALIRIGEQIDHLVIMESKHYLLQHPLTEHTVESSSFSIQNQKMELAGVRLGETEQEVVATLGPADATEEVQGELDSLAEHTLFYSEQEITFKEDKVQKVTWKTNEETVRATIIDPFPGERYINEVGTIYLVFSETAEVIEISGEKQDYQVQLTSKETFDSLKKQEKVWKVDKS